MRRRNAAEARFKAYGIVAIALALATLAIMLFTIFRDGTSAFYQATPDLPDRTVGRGSRPQGQPPSARR